MSSLDKEISLTSAQQEVVDHREGPLLVQAVAGSGKTTALVYRIAAMVRDGIPASSILAMAFNKDAAEIMNKRLDRILGEGTYNRPRVGTIHSVCLEIVRKGSPWEDFDVNESRTRGLLKTVLGFSGMKWEQADLTIVRRFIQRAKEELIYPEKANVYALITQKEWGRDHPPHLLSDAYLRFEKAREENRLIDYADMLFLAFRHLKEDPNALARWQSRFSHVMVDEFQDVNLAQYEIARMLAAPEMNLCAIGDVDQSIYKFRGARPEFMLGFQKTFGGKVVKMETNHRSTPEIVDFSSRVISRNVHRLEQTMRTERPSGQKIQVEVSENLYSEANLVRDMLKEIQADGDQLGNVVVLFRTNAQSMPIEETLIGTGIPFWSTARFSFWDRKEILDLLAYAKIAAGRDKDEKAFRRIVNVPFRYIGNTTRRMAEERIGNGFDTFQDALHDALSQGRQRQGLEDLTDLLERIQEMEERSLGASAILDRVVTDTDYLRYLVKNEGSDEPDNPRTMNVELLLSLASRFQTCSEFLDHTDEVARESRKGKKAGNLVTLSTIHKAKGMEFGTVFLIGANERLLPHGLVKDVEEERRLCYVAATRTMDRLVVSFVKHAHLVRGKTEIRPSRFLLEGGLAVPGETTGFRLDGTIAGPGHPKG